jgi:hypothetical protein
MPDEPLSARELLAEYMRQLIEVNNLRDELAEAEEELSNHYTDFRDAWFILGEPTGIVPIYIYAIGTKNVQISSIEGQPIIDVVNEISLERTPHAPVERPPASAPEDSPVGPSRNG